MSLLRTIGRSKRRVLTTGPKQFTSAATTDIGVQFNGDASVGGALGFPPKIIVHILA
jgi:hypothetical protein